MAIDALIKDIIFENGECFLKLIDRPPRWHGDYIGCRGQGSLKVFNPKPEIHALKGCCIWGSSDLYYNDFKIGKRVSPCRVELYYSNFPDPFVMMWESLFC